MTVSPITVATQGLLNSPLSVAAVRGRLRLPVGPLPPSQRPPGGDSGLGPSYVRGTWRHPFVIKEELRRQIEREDEEILAIIMAAMRFLQ